MKVKTFGSVYEFAIDDQTFGICGGRLCQKERLLSNLDIISAPTIITDNGLTSRGDRLIYAAINRESRAYLNFSIFAEKAVSIPSEGDVYDSYEKIEREIFSMLFTVMYETLKNRYQNRMSMMAQNPPFMEKCINDGPFIDARFLKTPMPKDRYFADDKRTIAEQILSSTVLTSDRHAINIEDMFRFLDDPGSLVPFVIKKQEAMEFLDNLFWSATTTQITLTSPAFYDTKPPKEYLNIDEISSKARTITVYFSFLDGTEGSVMIDKRELWFYMERPGICIEEQPSNYRYDCAKQKYFPYPESLRGKHIGYKEGLHREFVSEISVINVPSKRSEKVDPFIREILIPWSRVNKIVYRKRVLYQR